MSVVENIIKNDGRVENYNPEKYHRRTNIAAEGLNCSASLIEMHAAASIIEGSSSQDIQKALIKAGADLITPEFPDYEIATARLLNQKIRKDVYGQWEPKPLLEMINNNAKAGYYDGKYLFEHYTEEDINRYQKLLNFERDENFVYSGLAKVEKSYLMKRYGKTQETPQEMFLLIVMFAFAKYKGKLRDKWVKEGYDILSTFEASLPTPIMIQLRTAFRRFISCNVLAMGDSKETLANAARAIYLMVAGGAGLGVQPGDIRGINAPIDNGRLEHTGYFPIGKSTEKNTKAFVQPSRDGSATNYYPFFHIEIKSFMVLGNNKGTEETRIREMDHAIIFNDLFFERYLKGEDITLFFMNDVEDLTSFMGFPEKFKEKYLEAERTIPAERTVKVKASELLNLFADERFLQSREYCMFADNMQQQGMFKVPVKSSNLCAEITLPTFPIRGISLKRNIKFRSDEDMEKYYLLRQEAYFYQINDEKVEYYKEEISKYFEFVNPNDMLAEVDETIYFDYFDLRGKINLSEIAVCILAGINLGYVTNHRLPIVSEFLVRFLEELIDYMDYDLPEVEKAAKMRRTLGIGFSDVFHDLAKNKQFYNTKEGRQYIHDRTELAAYHMIRTSIELAKEKGPCMLYRDSKYSDGIFPRDTAKHTIKELVNVDANPFNLDWDLLKSEAKQHGVRHSTLMANAPFGSSAMVSNSTSGIEPPRKLVNSKKGDVKIVPDYKKYGKYYTTAWGEDFNNVDYFKFVAVVQKSMCQSVSTNQYTNLIAMGGKVKKSQLIIDILTAYRYGLKTLYYSNIISNNRKDGEDLEDDALLTGEEIDNGDAQSDCASGACKV